MWLIEVVCSNPECGEELEVILEELDEVEAVACECGACTTVIAVANFEPVYAVTHRAPG
jgi:hypothetical protein